MLYKFLIPSLNNYLEIVSSRREVSLLVIVVFVKMID